MTLESITRSKLAEELALIDEGGKVSERAVADLLRAPLARWGLSPKRAVVRHAREQLKATGVDGGSSVTRILERLLGLGECQEVFVGHERYLAPAEPRWMPTGDGKAVFLSASALPEGVSRYVTNSSQDITQRIQVPSDDDLARLQIAGVREVHIEEWLMPPHYLRHASRRIRRPTRSDAVALEDFWDILTTALADEGLPLSADAQVRTVTGAPGDYFGRHDAPSAEGRWTENAPDGLWCAFRRGYTERHWHPAIVSVDGQERRALDLFDLDEWRWALLARGRKLRSDEVVSASEEEVGLSFPAPTQIQAAMDLIGVRSGPWSWEWPKGAPDLWAFVR
jgi:hypothetical protein